MYKHLRLLRLPGLFAFISGAAASIYASYYYRSLDTSDYKITAILSLGVATVSLLFFSIATVTALFRQAHTKEASEGITIMHGSDRIDFGAFVQDAHASLSFMGVIAKRSVASDLFKQFLSHKRDTPIEIRFLLLDPRSSVFCQRARDENESSEAWISDLKSTVKRLMHYSSKYNVPIKIRFYDTYPIWRLMIRDNGFVAANMFLMGKRGTESSQIVTSSSTSEFGQTLRSIFETTWNYSSREVANETDIA